MCSQESRGREALEERRPNLLQLSARLPVRNGLRTPEPSFILPGSQGQAADQASTSLGTRAFPTDATWAPLPGPQAVVVAPPASSCACGCTEGQAPSSGRGQAVVPLSALTLEASPLLPVMLVAHTLSMSRCGLSRVPAP